MWGTIKQRQSVTGDNLSYLELPNITLPLLKFDVAVLMTYKRIIMAFIRYCYILLEI